MAKAAVDYPQGLTLKCAHSSACSTTGQDDQMRNVQQYQVSHQIELQKSPVMQTAGFAQQRNLAE